MEINLSSGGIEDGRPGRAGEFVARATGAAREAAKDGYQIDRNLE